MRLTFKSIHAPDEVWELKPIINSSLWIQNEVYMQFLTSNREGSWEWDWELTGRNQSSIGKVQIKFKGTYLEHPSPMGTELKELT